MEKGLILLNHINLKSGLLPSSNWATSSWTSNIRRSKETKKILKLSRDLFETSLKLIFNLFKGQRDIENLTTWYNLHFLIIYYWFDLSAANLIREQGAISDLLIAGFCNYLLFLANLYFFLGCPFFQRVALSPMYPHILNQRKFKITHTLWKT